MSNGDEVRGIWGRDAHKCDGDHCWDSDSSVFLDNITGSFPVEPGGTSVL